jgi:magnesium transporter
MLATLSAKEGGLTWTHVSEPTPEELAQVVRESQLTTLDAEFIAQDHHRPEITVAATYIILLITVPVFNRETRVTSGTPLYLISSGQRLWTVHFSSLPALAVLWQTFSENAERREEYFSDGALGLALHIVGAMYASAFRKLERLSKHINIAEDAVFQGNERKMVEEISILMRDVLDFRKIIRPQRSLFAPPPPHPQLTPTLLPQWHRLDGQVNKLWELLASLFEGTRELLATNNSLVQHKENELLRLLTYYSIFSIPVFLVLSPINPRAAGTPFVDKALYWGVLGVLVVVLLLIFARFKGKRVL